MADSKNHLFPFSQFFQSLLDLFIYFLFISLICVNPVLKYNMMHQI